MEWASAKYTLHFFFLLVEGNYCHQKLTEKLFSKERTWCQYLGGIYNISPGHSKHSRFLACAKSGKDSKSGFSMSTCEVLNNKVLSCGYRKLLSSSGKSVIFLEPTIWASKLCFGSKCSGDTVPFGPNQALMSVSLVSSGFSVKAQYSGSYRSFFSSGTYKRKTEYKRVTLYIQILQLNLN